jgi:hypothetical protein
LPKDVSSFPLLDALQERGFQASVIATYSCYFPFFEEVVLRRLLDRGCINNVLLVDAGRCAEAFASEETRPRRAGSDYTLIPVHLHGAFHPKLIVRIGKSKGSLLVGSHNMTLAGFGLNDELTNEFRTSGQGARQGAEILRLALDYLHLFVPTNLPELAQAFTSVRLNIPWLEGPIALPSDDRILMTTTGRDTDLWTRLRPLIPKRRVTVFTCGPFFDSNLGFLKKLVNQVKPDRLVVGIDPESVEINLAAVSSVPGAQFVNISGMLRIPNRRDTVSAYMHAKILWFKGSDGELLVTGSANPSTPAFLSDVDRRNAEAIVVDRRTGSAAGLGIDALVDAPNVTEDDWKQVKSRQTLVAETKSPVSGTLILAVPTEVGFIAQQPIGKKVMLDAFASDSKALGQAVTSNDDETLILAPVEVRDRAQTLRGTRTLLRSHVTLLVHRPEEVARNVGGDRQRELRRALGALEEDPAQLDTLLKLTEKVIFDSDDIITEASPTIRKAQLPSDRGAKLTGPESLAVEAAGRRSGRKKKSLASGDILVLLDALMYRLGEGLAGRTVLPEQSTNDDGDPNDGYGSDKGPPAQPPPYELLAHACRGKVGRLVRRMIKQLEHARSASARRAIVQLAAVLSVIHMLRNMEQRVEWRSKHLLLVDSDHEWEIFEKGSLALTWGPQALVSRALQEGDREPFKEISLAIGLLAWFAWEVQVDVKAAVERKTPLDPEQDDDPWYPIQVLAAVAPALAADEEAREHFFTAVNRTPRKGHDVKLWLATHISFAETLEKIVASPDRVRKTDRAPKPGDLIILRAALDPRVRVALAVAPSGNTTKITVLDEENEDHERHILATHVTYVGWMDTERPLKPAAAGDRGR